MAKSALRNISPTWWKDIAPQAPQKPVGQQMSDVLGGMALATAPFPGIGDVAGAVSDAAMYAAYPEERTMMNAGMSLAGLLPFVPAASFIKAAKGSINVGSDVKNMGSIPASLENYEIVDGLQMLPINAFETTKAKDLFYAKNDMDRVRQLSEQIEANKRIDPLIVVQDAEGYYVLEGGHRLGALDAIGAENVPAIIVKDLDNPYISELAPSPLEGTLDMSQAARMQRAAEGAMDTYYHGGKLAGPINEAGGLFNGIFVSPSKIAAMSHGNSLYSFEIPPAKIAKSGDFMGYSDIPWEQQKASIRRTNSSVDVDGPDFDLWYKAVVDDKADQLDADDLARIFGKEDAGENLWEAQRQRGRLAKELGYDAVEMSDEHGTSVLLVRDRPYSKAEKK